VVRSALDRCCVGLSRLMPGLRVEALSSEICVSKKKKKFFLKKNNYISYLVIFVCCVLVCIARLHIHLCWIILAIFVLFLVCMGSTGRKVAKKIVLAKLKELNVECVNVRRANKTTFPVFLGDSFVFKVFDSEEAWMRECDGLTFCAENDVTANLVPRLIASGKLSSVLHFVLMSRLRGESARQLLVIPANAAAVMAATIGRALRVLHSRTSSKSVSQDLRMRSWCALMSERRSRVSSQLFLRKRIKNKNALAQLDEQSSFWPVNWSSLFRWGDESCYLHGDLNNENVLLDMKKTSSSSAQIGLLDFSDSFYGHRLFDFVAVHLSVFACEKPLLSICLHNYGIELLPDSSSFFAYICMVYTFLSDSPAFKTAAFCRPQIKHCSTLEEMATLLFDLNKP
jgi:hypothetical protein